MKQIQTQYGLQFEVSDEISLYTERELVCGDSNESFTLIRLSPLKQFKPEHARIKSKLQNLYFHTHIHTHTYTYTYTHTYTNTYTYTHTHTHTHT